MDRLAGNSEAASQNIARRGLTIDPPRRRFRRPGGARPLMFFFASGLLATLLGFKNVPLQTLATALTVLAVIYLSAGCIIAGTGLDGTMEFLNAIVVS